jgi:hypothetical protein
LSFFPDQLPDSQSLKNKGMKTEEFNILFKEGAHIGGMAPSVTKLVWFGYISHLSREGGEVVGYYHSPDTYTNFWVINS